MQERLRELEVTWKAEGRPCFHTRLGLNTGKVIIGNVGTTERFDYSIIGDNVNLASRLEGINSYYGTRIIISDATRQGAGNAFVTRELDRISVKGKKEFVGIFELVGRRGEVTAPTLELLERYARALDLYKQGDWPTAVAAFEALHHDFPADGPTSTLWERCREFEKAPPPHWSGGYSFTHK